MIRPEAVCDFISRPGPGWIQDGDVQRKSSMWPAGSAMNPMERSVPRRGRASEIGHFIRQVSDRMSGYIVGVESTDSEATGEFSGFEVRYS